MSRNILRAGVAIAALGASALTAESIMSSRRRLREWETLTCADAEDGGFVTLSDGAQMHHIARGQSGDPVILIHGLMSSAYEWQKNIDALAGEHRVYAIDLIGFGFSTRVAQPCYSLRYFARTVHEFIASQGITRASLVGHSLGGAVALQFAYDYPAATDRLVLLAPGIYLVKYCKPIRYAASVPYLPQTIMSMVVCNPRAQRVSLRNALGRGVPLDEETLAARQRITRVKGTLDALLAMSRSPHASDLRLRIADIEAPTLIMWGDQDIVVPLEHGKRLVRELPQAELVVLEGAGHLPNEQYPDIVNRRICAFLKSSEISQSEKHAALK